MYLVLLKRYSKENKIIGLWLEFYTVVVGSKQVTMEGLISIHQPFAQGDVHV